MQISPFLTRKTFPFFGLSFIPLPQEKASFRQNSMHAVIASYTKTMTCVFCGVKRQYPAFQDIACQAHVEIKI